MRNQLSGEVVNASSLASFKYKLQNTDLSFDLIGKPLNKNFNSIQCAVDFVHLCYQALSYLNCFIRILSHSVTC